MMFLLVIPILASSQNAHFSEDGLHDALERQIFGSQTPVHPPLVQNSEALKRVTTATTGLGGMRNTTCVARHTATLDYLLVQRESLEDSANFPPPEVIAAGIVEDLEAALAVCGDRGCIGKRDGPQIEFARSGSAKALDLLGAELGICLVVERGHRD